MWALLVILAIYSLLSHSFRTPNITKGVQSRPNLKLSQNKGNFIRRLNLFRDPPLQMSDSDTNQGVEKKYAIAGGVLLFAVFVDYLRMRGFWSL
jgi:hypothetical protein